jgi:hypothetical protein
MPEVLTQWEIDQLLAAINAEDSSKFGFDNLESFEKYLKKRNDHQEEPYGMFEKDISVCRFFDGKGNDNLLADIKRKNEDEGMGNVKIPNTDITLINYSICPKCKKIFSFADIVSYYKNPIPDTKFKSRSFQYRNDARVYCYSCQTFFLPSLVISETRPVNEVQFLCRAQTVEEVEKYMWVKNMKVLTKKKSNIILNGNFRAIKNDVSIIALKDKPTLITNIIQYTPFNQILNFIDGTNIEKGDLLFDEWKEAKKI